MSEDLVQAHPHGLYVPRADVWIDPMRAVDHAIVTHAHADHARRGPRVIHASAPTLALMEQRYPDPEGERVPLAWGEPYVRHGVQFSLHPAGHILGSAQVRVACGDQVWVVTGDYRRQVDGSAEPFEVVPCDTLVTECTFGLPVYRWPTSEAVFAEIGAWIRHNRALGRSSVLLAYALGKAQRLLMGLKEVVDGPVWVHGAVASMNRVYEAQGVPLGTWKTTGELGAKDRLPGAVVIAPPAVAGSRWLKRFGPSESAMVSGWMQIRGMRRRRAVARGFVLSDHVDWPDLLRTVRETGARRVLATHGRADVLVRYLKENGLDAQALELRSVDREDEA